MALPAVSVLLIVASYALYACSRDIDKKTAYHVIAADDACSVQISQSCVARIYIYFVFVFKPVTLSVLVLKNEEVLMLRLTLWSYECASCSLSFCFVVFDLSIIL